jgi:hypothetical protein
MSDSARFELFSFWRTSATYRVRVAFNLKGVQPREQLDAFAKADPTRQVGAPQA